MKLPKLRLSFPNLGKLITQYEKAILAILSIVIVISGSVWYRQFSASQSEPIAGGSYVEGVVRDQADIQQIATRLTKTGLLRFDRSGRLQNQLTTDWQANQDKTEFVFTLLPGISTDEVKTEIEHFLHLTGRAEVSTAEGQRIIISLPVANPSFPLLMTAPIVSYGPYKISKSTDKTIIFTRNVREHAAKAYLNKIVIHLYPDSTSLERAWKKGKLDGFVINGSTGEPPPKGFIRQTIRFPRYYVALFNHNKAPLRERNFRLALTGQAAISPTPFTLVTTDREPNLSLAQDLINSWQTKGSKVVLETKPLDEIETKIGPSRNFQVLLTGIDYGTDLDPYHLWHSSQLRPPGNNLTGIKNDQIDAMVQQIRETYALPERQALIEALHQYLQGEGVALILRQDSVDLMIRDRIRFVQPWLALTPLDRFQAVALWSIK